MASASAATAAASDLATVDAATLSASLNVQVESVTEPSITTEAVETIVPAYSKLPANSKHLAHAVLMVVAWGALLPSSALLPRCWRWAMPTVWLKVHKWINVVAALLTVVGVVIIYDLRNQWQIAHFSDAHSVIGLALTVVAVLQLVSGFFRPSKSRLHSTQADRQHSTQADPAVITPAGVKKLPEAQTSSRRRVWHGGHALAGYAMLGLGVVQVPTGVALGWGLESMYGLYGALAGTSVLLALIGLLLGSRRAWTESQALQTKSVMQTKTVTASSATA